MAKVGLTTLKVGDKVKVVAVTSGHSTPIGTQTKISRGFIGGTYMIEGSRQSFYPADLEWNDVLRTIEFETCGNRK